MNIEAGPASNPPQTAKNWMEEPQRKPFYSQRSFWSLLVANLVVIVWARIRDWELVSLLWIYWSQSLIIGLFWFFRILELKDFQTQVSHTDDFIQSWRQDIPGSKYSKMENAFRDKGALTATHIVLNACIHVKFALWISSINSDSAVPNLRPVLIGAVIFFVSQCMAFTKSNRWIAKCRPNALIIAFPTIRVLPISLAIGLYATANTLLVFLAAKTFVDLIVCAVEHSCFGDSTHPERTFLDYERPPPEHEICEFCQEVIEPWHTPWVIKEHIVCRKCFDSIQKQKAKDTAK